MRKLHLTKTLVFTTTSMQLGIFLPPNAMINLIMLSCLARAQRLYRVEIVAFSISTTHIHLILVIYDPDDFKEFMRHFKSESSHAINNIMGVPNRNLWCEGYDSPIVLDSKAATERIAYTYANPAKDGLVDSIEDYPGLSSWKYAERERTVIIPCTWIPRSSYVEIDPKSRNPAGYAKEAGRLVAQCIENAQTLRISPTAWLDVYGVNEPGERAQKQKEVIQRTREIEIEARERRRSEKRTVIGKTKLIKTAIGAHYIPRRSGRRTYFLSVHRSLRKKFIAKLKLLFGQADEIRDLHRKGDITTKFPLGMYPAAFRKLAHPISVEDMLVGVE